ncbi:MAG: hypothetical protein HYT49_01550 [Candidatus Wildermuthbacteria bacterium]|nr:hypothetical protein [Candidatus Wildermuthbacteria bacterium]
MGFGFLSFAPKKGNNVLVLRVGEREVDFLLFKNAGEGIRVLAYGSEDTSHFHIGQVLEKIFAQLPREERIHELRVTFGTSSFRAQVITLTLPPKTPSHVFDDGEASLIEKEVRARAARALQRSLFRESGILPNEFSLRRVKILGRRIAGYSVPKLAGAISRELEFSLLGVFLLESAFVPMREFAKTHRIAEMSVIHIAEALESFARKSGREGVYLCMGEERTQIAVQTKDRFAFLGTVSMGAQSFTEFFADRLGMRESTARVFQQQYFENSLSVGVQEKMQAYLLPEIQKFGTLIKQKLLEAKIVLPGSLWVFGRGDVLRNLQSLFAHETLEDLPFSQKPKISFLLPEDVWGAKNFPGARNPFYTELCLLSAFTLNRR